MDPTYFMQSQDLRTTDDDIADPINERLTLAERNERLQNQLRSLKEDLSHTRDETGQLLPIAGFSCCLFWYTNLWFFSPAKARFSRKFWFGRKFCCDLFFFLLNRYSTVPSLFTCHAAVWSYNGPRPTSWGTIYSVFPERLTKKHDISAESWVPGAVPGVCFMFIASLLC